MNLFVYRAVIEDLAEPRAFDGQPAYPVLDECELEYIRSLSDLYEIQLRVVALEETEPRESSMIPGVVVCAEPRWRNVCRFYAAQTGRSNLTLDRAALRDFVLGGQLTVLVFGFEEWTVDFIEDIQPIQSDHQSPVVGLIPVHDVADAFRECVRRAVALHLSHLVPLVNSNQHGVVTEVVMDAAIGELNVDSVRFLGARASASSVRDAVAAGAEVLAISTHSDGLDSPLPDGLVICSQSGATVRGERVQPICIASGVCHRRGHAPLGDPAATRGIIHAFDLKAKLLFYRACYVLLPGDPAGMPVRSTLGAALLRQAVYTCLVTAVEVIFSNAIRVHREVTAIAAGGSVVEALQRIAEMVGDEGSRARFFCFGDPASAIRTRHTGKVAAIGEIGNVRPPVGTAQEIPPILAYSEMLLKAFESTSTTTWSSTSKCNAAHQVWAAAKTSIALRLRASMESVRLEQGIDDDLARCLPYIKQEIVAAWFHAGAQFAGLSKVRCPHCHTPAQGIRCQFSSLSKGRDIVNCPRCGLSRDVAIGMDSQLTISSEGVVNLVKSQRSLNRRYFVRLHAHQLDGPTVDEVEPVALLQGYAMRSPFAKAIRAQISVFALADGLVSVDSRYVSLLR